MSEAPITKEEMKTMFGNTLPMEAIALLWDGPDDKTIGQVRAELRSIAAKRKTYIYLTAQRKAWHHDTTGWNEEAFERFSYVECGVFSKPTLELNDSDKQMVESHGKPDDDFRMPSGFYFPNSTAQAEIA